MGLDMYLNIELNFSVHSDSDTIAKINDVLGIENIWTKSNSTGKDILYKDSVNVDSVSISVGYWRKANWIHKWFVDNVQDGEDNNKEYIVDEEKLEELYNLCKSMIEMIDNEKVFTGRKLTVKGVFGNYEENEISETANLQLVRDQIEELLPVSDSGFFFGTYKKDIENDDKFGEFIEYYYMTLNDTVKYIDAIRELEKNSVFRWLTVKYSSSW